MARCTATPTRDRTPISPPPSPAPHADSPTSDDEDYRPPLLSQPRLIGSSAGSIAKAEVSEVRRHAARYYERRQKEEEEEQRRQAEAVRQARRMQKEWILAELMHNSLQARQARDYEACAAREVEAARQRQLEQQRLLQAQKQAEMEREAELAAEQDMLAYMNTCVKSAIPAKPSIYGIKSSS